MFAGVLDRSLSQARAFCEAHPPESLSGAQAAEVVAKAAKASRYYAATQVLYAARVEETGAYRDRGHRDAASFLGSLSGEPVGVAKEALSTAKELSGSEAAKDAYRSGQLSGAQAKELARVASTGEEVVSELVEKAKDPKASFGDLRKEADRAAQAARSEEDEAARDARTHRRRSFRLWRSPEGGVAGQLLLDDVDGARVLARVRSHANRLWRRQAKIGTPESHDCYMADALVELVTGTTSLGPEPATTGRGAKGEGAKGEGASGQGAASRGASGPKGAASASDPATAGNDHGSPAQAPAPAPTPAPRADGPAAQNPAPSAADATTPGAPSDTNDAPAGPTTARSDQGGAASGSTETPAPTQSPWSGAPVRRLAHQGPASLFGDDECTGEGTGAAEGSGEPATEAGGDQAACEPARATAEESGGALTLFLPDEVVEDEDDDDEVVDGQAVDRPRVLPPDAHVQIHISLEALARGSVESGERCEIEGLGPLSVAQVRKVLCDASYHLLIENGIDVLRVSATKRTATTSQKRALVVRDPTCVVPGCDISYGLQTHHWQVEYQGGIGKTVVSNLCRLCTRHHTMLHHDGWQLSGGPGNWSFDRPDPTDQPKEQHQHSATEAGSKSTRAPKATRPSPTAKGAAAKGTTPKGTAAKGTAAKGTEGIQAGEASEASGASDTTEAPPERPRPRTTTKGTTRGSEGAEASPQRPRPRTVAKGTKRGTGTTGSTDGAKADEATEAPPKRPRPVPRT